MPLPTYKVGQAPWEVQSAPASFPVGKAPWEISSTTPTPAKEITQSDIPALQGFNRFSAGVTEAKDAGINQIKAGVSQMGNVGSNPINLVEGGFNAAAGVVNTALSPLAPIFKPLGDAINYVGNKISDIPEVQKFANSGLGNITSRVAEDVNNLMTVVGAVAGATEKVSPKTNYIGATSPVEAPIPKVSSSMEKIVAKRTEELNKLDSQYAQLRKASGYSDDGGVASRQRVASTDVLDGAVDDNGVIRTTQPGGAVDQYRAMTLDNAENVVRKNLEAEGGKTNLGEVEIRLNEAVNNSGLEGADLKVALNKVKQEISGLRLKADEAGDIPNTLLQDAKISTTRNINYQTPPEVSTYRKAIANGYKTTIEKNSTFNVKEVNAELAKYLQDIEFLKRLDGKRVSGGKLGKYFAQISGNIIGGMAGSAVGGPIGSALGTMVGGELAGRIKGNLMSKTFKGQTGNMVPKNPIIEAAIKTGNQEKSLGSRNAQYETAKTKSKSSMPETVPQKKGLIQKAVDKYKSIPNKQGGFVTIDGKVFREVAEATKREMIQMIDYLRLKQEPNKASERTLSDLAQKYNINQDWSNQKIANLFEKLIEETKTR